MTKCSFCGNDAVGTFGFRSKEGSVIGASLCKEHKDIPTIRLVTEDEYQVLMKRRELEER
jgi:hypothetical protein